MRKDGFTRFSLSGAAAGIVNGLFGAGGGMILVPLLNRFGKLKDKETFATSLSVIFPLSLISIIVHSTRQVLPICEGLPYLIGGTIGGTIGALALKKVSSKYLHLLFGILIIWGGIRLLR